MPSLLPILSYDVSTTAQDESISLPASNVDLLKPAESNGSCTSSSVLKKHKDLPKKKKKLSKQSRRTSAAAPTSSLPDSVVTDNNEAPETVVISQAIGEAVKLMKKAVYTVQMALYNGLRDHLQLQAATHLLTQSEYADVVTERSNDKQCGYPLCSNSLKLEKMRKGRFHISLSQHKVFDLEESRPFCSTVCQINSKTYESRLRLNHEGIFERQKLEEIIAGVRGLNVSSKMSASAQVRDLGVVIHERADDGDSDAAGSEFSGSGTTIEGYTPRKYVTVGSDGKPLKSAIKQSPRKHQRITWADEKPVDAEEEEDSFSFLTRVADSEDSSSDSVGSLAKERLGLAQTVAEALSVAASASSLGEVEACNAASSAGLSIRPPLPPEDEENEEVASRPPEEEENEETIASRPEEEEEVVLGNPAVFEETSETDIADALSNQSSWYDAPPKAFRAEISAFGLLWMALDGWVTTATLAHIYGRENDETDEFRSVNGRFVPDAEASSSPEILRTISSCMSRVLPDVVQALGLSMPLSVIEQAVGRLLGTMSFVQALPPFVTKQWRVIGVLFLDALSVRRLSALQMTINRALLRKFLLDCGTNDADYETFKQILLPL